MALPPNLNQEKLSEAALAILGLTAFRDHHVVRAWKGMDWDLLDVLYQKGWIDDPKGKAKSVVLTDEGAQLAAPLLPGTLLHWSAFGSVPSMIKPFRHEFEYHVEHKTCMVGAYV